MQIIFLCEDGDEGESPLKGDLMIMTIFYHPLCRDFVSEHFIKIIFICV
jgi:hypothetical protein